MQFARWSWPTSLRLASNYPSHSPQHDGAAVAQLERVSTEGESMSAFVIPGGNSKGTPISEAQVKDLEYWVGRLNTDLEANPGKNFADRDRSWLAAARAELERRRSGGAPASPGSSPRAATPPQGTRAPLARREVAGLAASYRQGMEANKALHQAAEVAHLVSPATAVGELPAGTVLALSQVVVGVEEETYPLPAGKRGLGKVALDKLAAAAGISWDALASGRLDDGSDPHYCHFRAVGSYRSFDGSRLSLSGEVEIDLRVGSPQVEEMITKAAGKERGVADKQILEARKFILRHAESKARNRAVRCLGLRTSYTPAELQKPFVVAKVMFTGHSEDPEIKREFARATATAFLSGTSALYPNALPARSSSRGHAPPSVEEREAYDTEGESAPEYEAPFQGTGTDGLDPEDHIPY